MTTPDPAVTAIIPNLGLRERADCLRAAIQSTIDQRGVAMIVRVVINESKRDPQVERELRDNVHIGLVVRDARGGLDPVLRAYDLRHTNISALLAAGEQLLMVSKRVGHKSAKMTLDVYGHAFKSDQRSTVVLDKVMELWKVGNS